MLRKMASGLIVMLLLGVVSLPLHAATSNKWRLELDGRAKVPGQLELSFTPKGGVGQNVTVDIPKGMSENAAARLLRDTLRTTFGKSPYKFEVDDGEDVLVKRRFGTPVFEIKVVRNTVNGLRITLDRE
jgi:hypothetical protein